MAVPIPDPPFGGVTFETILQRMFDNMDSGLDTSEGSLAWNLLAPLAIELAQVHAAMDQAVEFGFLQEAYGKFLDARAQEHGVTRKAAVKATGQVTFSGVNGTVIPAGRTVTTTVAAGSEQSAVSFQTTAQATITAGTADVAIEAVNAGLDGNVPAGSITRIVGLISGVSSVTNAAATTGGADIESDEALRDRTLEAVAANDGAGTPDDYNRWALEVSGVGAASTTPIWNGAGTVRVMILDTNLDPAGAPLISDVADYIETLRPIGATVTVDTPTAVAVPISVTLSMEPGYTVVGQTTAVEAALQTYFDTLGPGDDVILTEVGAAIVTSQGVADYSSLLLDGVAANKVISATQIAQLGAVTLS